MSTIHLARERALLQQRMVVFECARCGEKTDAPQGTKRLELSLCRQCLGKKVDTRKNELNELTGKEWAVLSKSVEQYNGVRSVKQRVHGAAFPISLVESQLQIYTKRGDLVLDPFLGVGTTSQAAESLQRRSIGIELNSRFAKLASRDITDRKNHIVICNDVRNMRTYIKHESVDFSITSPPYATLLKRIRGAFAYKWREHSELNVLANPRPYSKSKNDLGNLAYDEFMACISNVFRDLYWALKPNTYAVWVVKDYRDLENGAPYVNFHGDIIHAAICCGFVLWDIRIYDQTKFRPLVVLGYPSRNYYLNIGHSYLLVFKKHIGTFKRTKKK